MVGQIIRQERTNVAVAGSRVYPTSGKRCGEEEPTVARVSRGANDSEVTRANRKLEMRETR